MPDSAPSSGAFKKPGGRPTRRVFGVLLVLGLGFCSASLATGWMLVLPRTRLVGLAPAGAEAFTLESANGASLKGWLVEAANSRGVVLLLHGLGGDRRAMWPRALWLRELRFSSVLIDLRAHGESEGLATTAGNLEREDVRAAAVFALQRFEGQPLAILGVSLGGAAALLAGPLGQEALILESVFPSLEQALRNRVRLRLGILEPLATWSLLVQVPWRLGIEANGLRPIDALADCNCPILILSGDADQYTTPQEIRDLFAAALARPNSQPAELWLVPSAEHVDLHHYDPRGYEARVSSFLVRTLCAPKQSGR